MKLPEAVQIAQESLLWLAGQPEEIARFLTSSGLDPGELRRRWEEPGLLGFVLDFVLEHDRTVTAFATASGYPPEAVARARAALPGGDAPAWT